MTDSEQLADELSIAAAQGDYEKVVELRELANQSQLIDAKGWTALHWACQEGHLDIVRFLVEAGASVNALTTVEQLTPLIQAVGGGHVDVVKFLLESGAKPDTRFVFLGGVSSVEIARTYGFDSIVNLLSGPDRADG